MAIQSQALLDQQQENQSREQSRRAAAVGAEFTGSASLWTSSSNLILAVLGAGQLTLPYALSKLGLAFGLLSLVAFALLSVHSLYTLSFYSLHLTSSSSTRMETYSNLAVHVLGKAGGRLISFLLVAYAWGGALSFMVILKGEFDFFASLAVSGESVSGTTVLVLVGVVFIWPLSSLRDVSILRRTSPLGCCAALLVTGVVLACTRWTGHALLGAQTCEGPHGSNSDAFGPAALQFWPGSFMNIAAALPLFSFALNSSWAYIPIFAGLRDKSAGRVNSLIGIASAVILASYLLIAAYGYSMFCDATQPNILDSLGDAAPPGSPDRPLILFARGAVALQLTLALPLRFYVARTTIASNESRCIKLVLLSGALVGSAVALAALPLSLATVLGITSSVCASIIIYILPAVIDLRLALPGRLRKIFSIFSLLVGLFVLTAGLVANVLGVAVGS